MQTIQSADDLVTPKNKTVDGFKQQTSQKEREAKSYIDTGIVMQGRLKHISSIEEIIGDSQLYDFFVSACFLSKKSLSYISEAEQHEILKESINFDELQNEDYAFMLFARYLLTSGEALGGAMRNVVGQFAQKHMADVIRSKLKEKSMKFTEALSEKGKVISIEWNNRKLLFDKKPKFLGNSIDFILVAKTDGESGVDIENPSCYIACGELKGGIDPAGADEHWKTARTALNRIQDVFTQTNVPLKLFFVGAAIEYSMAQEIYDLLQKQWLRAAANLVNDEQMDELVDILTSL